MTTMTANKSTIVRSVIRMTASPEAPPVRGGAPVLPPWLRGGVGALSAVSPQLAARAAATLFFRTRRRPERAGEREVMVRGARFSVPFEGEVLRARSWGAGPTVLLAHGWNGRASQLAPFVDPLVSAGLRVVAFDHVGHGESTGAATTIVQMARATRAVTDASGGATAIVAHSLGAASATLALSEGLWVDRVVLIAPPIMPEPWFDGFARLLGLDGPTASATKRRIEAHVGRPMSSLRGPDIASDLTVPALIVHDRDDREVPITAAEALHAAWPSSRMLVTAGHGHRRILRVPGVHEATRRYLTRNGDRNGDRLPPSNMLKLHRF